MNLYFEIVTIVVAIVSLPTGILTAWIVSIANDRKHNGKRKGQPLRSGKA